MNTIRLHGSRRAHLTHFPTLWVAFSLGLISCTKVPEQQDPKSERDTHASEDPSLHETTGASPQSSSTQEQSQTPSDDTNSTSFTPDATEQTSTSSKSADQSSTASETPTFDIPDFAPEPTDLDYSIIVENPSDQPLTNVPITYGQVFLEGDVPAGHSLQGKINDTPVLIQVDKKSTHSDKSLRHAVLSLVVPSIGPGESIVVKTPAYQGESNNNPAEISALIATGLSSTLTLDVQERVDPNMPQEPGNTKVVQYKVELQDLFQTGIVERWLSGPVVTEWMTSGSLKRVSDDAEHPHLSARFHIRYYPATSSIRVDLAVENNWAFAEKPQNIYYDADFKINGTTRFSIDHLPHFKQSRWRKTYWVNGVPKVDIKHRPEVLIDSKAVPHYDRRLIGKLDPSILKSQNKAWTDEVLEHCAHFRGGSKSCNPPLAPETRLYRLSRKQPMGKGLVFYTGMASPGDTDMLGPLPTWSAAYVLDQNPFTKEAMLGTGDLGGSWGIHYRDRSTGLPLSMQAHPRATIDSRFESKNELLPLCTKSFSEDSLECAVLYKPDTAHQPSLAYLPYLVTGDYYYLEEMQFWATYNALANRPEYRKFEKGIFANFEDRGQAWTLRKLARVAAFTPDDHALKSEFVAMLDANLDHYSDLYLKKEPNGFGSLISRIYPRSSPWMDDFFTWAIQMTANLGFEKAKAFAKWKGSFPVMRMGRGSENDNDFCYIFAPAYHLRIGAGTGLDDVETVGMFKTIKEVYEATNNKDINPSPNIEEIQFDDGGFPCGSQEMADHLGIPLGYLVNKPTASAGYVSILQMALASAVDAGTPAAREAWVRYQSLAAHPAGAKNPKYVITPRKL